jgi:hypothetical protein
LFGGSSAAGASAGGASTTAGGSGAGTASSQTSMEAQRSGFTTVNQLANQFGSRSGSQNSRDFGGYEMSGTPGVLEEGLMVRQRQELIRLPDVSKMLAEILIEEARVAQVKAGMTAYIRVRNVPHHRFKGTVRRVAILPDAQSSWMNPDKKLFPTDILVEEEMPILKPGVSAAVEVIITNLTSVLSVPIQTVARLEGQSVCFVKRGSRVTPVSVTTGWFNDAFVEITSGLKEGDFVLLAPVGDEETDESAEPENGATNHADTGAAPPRTRPVEDPSGAERQFQRRNSEPAEGAERPRNRQDGGRRSQNSNGPE